MTVLREDGLAAFLRQMQRANGLLVHATDSSARASVARMVAKAVGSPAISVDASAMKASPGAFSDAFLSMSLLGDRQLLAVEGADDACLGFLVRAIDYIGQANFVLVLADNLSKSSKLRSAAEAAKSFGSLAIYDEDDSRLRQRVRGLLQIHGQSWGPGAEEAFFESVGQERGVIDSEIEKLGVYANGKVQIDPGDVAAVCGEVAEYDAEELIDCILEGRMEAVDRRFAALEVDQRSFLILLQFHLDRLLGLRVEVEQGVSSEQVVANAKPPIFFKRKPAFMNQLRRLAVKDLVEMLDAVQEATLGTRQRPDLAAAILSRAILSLTRHAGSRLPT